MTHTVHITNDSRYAVVKPNGETLVILCDEFTAIAAANALNSQPVRSVEPRGTWTEKEQEAA